MSKLILLRLIVACLAKKQANIKHHKQTHYRNISRKCTLDESDDFSTILLRCLPGIFIATSIQPSLSLVDREVELGVSTNSSFSTRRALLFFFVPEKIPLRVTAPRFELESQRYNLSRLPTEPMHGDLITYFAN